MIPLNNDEYDALYKESWTKITQFKLFGYVLWQKKEYYTDGYLNDTVEKKKFLEDMIYGNVN